jgi:CBS domain-containing protein
MATVLNIMTPRPVCCTPNEPVHCAAVIMRDHDCGIVPIVEDRNTMRLLGVITDRDIVVRVVAAGKDPNQEKLGAYCSHGVGTVRPQASLEECRRVMETRQVRRVPVTDEHGRLVGIVSIADLAHALDADQVGHTVEEVSESDTRQLYSEVSEHGRSGLQVVSTGDHTHEHRVAS